MLVLGDEPGERILSERERESERMWVVVVVIGGSNGGERMCERVRQESMSESKREEAREQKERSGVANTEGGQCDIIAYSHGRVYKESDKVNGGKAA